MRDGTLTLMPPRTITVSGFPYNVAVVEKIDNEGTLGRVVYESLQIEVLKDQHPISHRDTVLHEVIHAIDRTTQLDLTERQVYVLAGQILDSLRRNPDFTAWLVS